MGLVQNRLEGGTQGDNPLECGAQRLKQEQNCERKGRKQCPIARTIFSLLTEEREREGCGRYNSSSPTPGRTDCSNSVLTHQGAHLAGQAQVCGTDARREHKQLHVFLYAKPHIATATTKAEQPTHDSFVREVAQDPRIHLDNG